MHNPSHSFRLVGQLSRNAYNHWKNDYSKRPLVRRVRSVLIWLPTIVVFTQVGYTMRAVTGNSMQVRSFVRHNTYRDFPFCPMRDTRTPDIMAKPTNYSHHRHHTYCILRFSLSLSAENYSLLA